MGSPQRVRPSGKKNAHLSKESILEATFEVDDTSLDHFMV
jgi:hypothetical protein